MYFEYIFIMWGRIYVRDTFVRFNRTNQLDQLEIY